MIDDIHCCVRLLFNAICAGSEVVEVTEVPELSSAVAAGDVSTSSSKRNSFSNVSAKRESFSKLSAPAPKLTDDFKTAILNESASFVAAVAAKPKPEPRVVPVPVNSTLGADFEYEVQENQALTQALHSLKSNKRVEDEAATKRALEEARRLEELRKQDAEFLKLSTRLDQIPSRKEDDYELQMAREAFRNAKTERKASRDRQAEALATLNAEKDKQDAFNKERRKLNARLERQRLEELRKQEEANMQELDRKVKKLLEEHARRRAAQKAQYEAKQKELKIQAEQAQKEAAKRRSSFKTHEWTLKRKIEADQAALRQVKTRFLRKIQEQEQMLQQVIESKQKLKIVSFSQDIDEDEDEEVAKQRKAVDRAYRHMTAEEEVYKAKIDKDEADLQQDRDQVERADQEARDKAEKGAQELAAIEAAQRDAELKTKQMEEELQREREAAQQRVQTLYKQVQAARLEEIEANATAEDKLLPVHDDALASKTAAPDSAGLTEMSF